MNENALSIGCKRAKAIRRVARHKLRERYGVNTDYEASMRLIADLKAFAKTLKK